VFLAPVLVEKYQHNTLKYATTTASPVLYIKAVSPFLQATKAHRERRGIALLCF
jgi:hypothetical protein